MAKGDRTKLKDRFVGDDAKPSKARCKGCRYPITRAESMVQWGRLVGAGLAEGEVKSASPRCQKCTTRFLREIRRGM